MGKLSEGVTYKNRTIFYIAIKPEDSIKAARCQLNRRSWQVYGLKIRWQLEALAKKKQTYTTFKTMLRLSTRFSHLKALTLTRSWQVRRTCPGRGSCVISLRSNNPLSQYSKRIKYLLLQEPDLELEAQRKGLSTLTKKAASMNVSPSLAPKQLSWERCSTRMKHSRITRSLLLVLLDLS